MPPPVEENIYCCNFGNILPELQYHNSTLWRCHRPFNLSIGLDEASCPEAGDLVRGDHRAECNLSAVPVPGIEMTVQNIVGTKRQVNQGELLLLSSFFHCNNIQPHLRKNRAFSNGVTCTYLPGTRYHTITLLSRVTRYQVQGSKFGNDISFPCKLLHWKNQETNSLAVFVQRRPEQK